MKEIIELLNQTSWGRLIFYCIIFLITLDAICHLIISLGKMILHAIFKDKQNKNKGE